MQNLKFKYIFQHEETGRMLSMIFTIEEIEDEQFKERWPKRYFLVDRLLFTGLYDCTKWLDLCVSEKMYFWETCPNKPNNAIYLDNIKDKWQGREVYEKDIVKENNTGRVLEVIWNCAGSGCWWFVEVVNKERYQISSIDLREIKIIGSSYLTPELLTEAKEMKK
jgi:hypothetical protein